MKIMQKGYRETQSCLKIKCHLLGWGPQVPEMFLSSLVFSELLKMDLAVLLEFDWQKRPVPHLCVTFYTCVDRSYSRCLL